MPIPHAGRLTCRREVVDWASFLEPRDRDEAKRPAATLFMVAAGVTLLFALVVPPPGAAARVVTLLLPAVLIVLSVLLLRLRSSERRLLWLWAPAPIVGILAIAGMDLATSDASAAGQVFLCYPVIYAASQLKPPAASWSNVGVRIGPPNVLGPPKPMSSISTITTLGAPLGAFISNRGGALTLRASSSLYVGRFGSWIGRIVRSSFSCAEAATTWPASTAVT